jgi:hypothetical protein
MEGMKVKDESNKYITIYYLDPLTGSEVYDVYEPGSSSTAYIDYLRSRLNVDEGHLVKRLPDGSNGVAHVIAPAVSNEYNFIEFQSSKPIPSSILIFSLLFFLYLFHVLSCWIRTTYF